MVLTRDEAEALMFIARAEKFRAEAHAAEALARRDEIEAAQLQIGLDRERFKRSKELASDELHHVYRFTSSVSGGSAGNCMGQLSTWHRLDPECPIELVFTSPGGEIISGMALFDYIVSLREAGHEVVTKTLGMAASMAGILLQAGTKRVMSPESWLLIHQASFGTAGDFGKVEDMVKWVERIQERILDIFSARSKMSRTQIKKRWHRKDWWISSDDALKWGFVDEVSP